MTQALVIFRPNKVNVLSTNLLSWLKSKLRSAGWKSEYNLSNVKWHVNRLFLWCTTAVQKNVFQRIHGLKLMFYPQALWVCDVKTLTSVLFVCTWIFLSWDVLENKLKPLIKANIGYLVDIGCDRQTSFSLFVLKML